MGFFGDLFKDMTKSGFVGNNLELPKDGAADIYDKEKKEDGSIDYDTGKKIGEALRKGTE